MITLLRTGLLAVLLAAPVSAQDSPRVYVALPTGASGFTDPGSKDRAAALKDLTGQLRDKKKVLVLVDNPDEADVRITVTQATIGSGDTSTARYNALSRSVESSNNKAYHVAVTLKAGDYETELTGSGMYTVIAAKQIAKDVESWVRDNRDQLIARRAK